ncbi:hypothetical protein GCM10025870_29340 [Agromyces marinus]|uniref:Peptidase M48 domain-containing protein n=1 Tax=Agromyces marinus TaxID=1389020 RepID=A0ABN6YIL6_9MICO|nr:hypothetical protein GCM10025870_29340 [Agromyces marinus]
MYRAIARNKRNTVFTILLFLAIVGGLGYLAAVIYGDLTIVVVTLVIAIGYALFQYFTADRQALAMSGAVEIRGVSDHPRLWRTVENLSITTGTPMPRVFVVSDPAPNAFATGRDPRVRSSPRRPGCSRSWTTPNSRASWPMSSGTCATTTSACR